MVIKRSAGILNARRAQNAARHTNQMNSFKTIKPCQLHALVRRRYALDGGGQNTTSAPTTHVPFDRGPKDILNWLLLELALDTSRSTTTVLTS